MTKSLPILSLSLMLLLTACTPPAEKARRLTNQGIKEMEKADLPGAIRSFNKALKTDSSNYLAYYYRGTCLFNSAHRNIDSVMKDLGAAIRLNPGFAESYATRGEVYAYLGDRENACRDWKSAQRLGKPNMRDKTRFCP